MEPVAKEIEYTQESLAALPSADLVKIILEQQAALKGKDADSPQRKRKLDEISSPAGEQPEVWSGPSLHVQAFNRPFFLALGGENFILITGPNIFHFMPLFTFLYQIVTGREKSEPLQVPV